MTVAQQDNNILKSVPKSRKDVHIARSARIRRGKHAVKEETQYNIPIPSTGLPTEIWLHIISYLLDYDLEPLTRVNQQLRDIALDVRFRKAFAAPGWTRHRNYFNAISYLDLHEDAPSVLHRVRELVFKDDPDVTVGLPIDYKPGSHFLSAWRRSIDLLFIPEHHIMLHYFNELLLQVDKLSRVQAITFHFNPASDYKSSPPVLRHPYLKYKMQIFHALSATQLSNITYLSLQTNLNVLLPHWRNDIVFPNLATLKVRVETNNTNDISPITKLFIPLVNNHHKSLIELVLTHSPYVDLKHVLGGINHLSKLQTLSLCWFTINSMSQQQAISKFIARHKARLVDLRLRILPITVLVVRSERIPTDDAKSVWNGLFDHNFPSLRYLSLLFKVPLEQRDTNTITDFLFRHKTLYSLTILPVETSSRLANLSVDVMAHFRSDNKLGFSFLQLQRLFIHSATLDIDLMAFFASSFPSLKYLCICGLTELLSDTAHVQRSTDLAGLFASWQLPDMVLESNSVVFSVIQKRKVIKAFAGVSRFSGLLPQSWLVGDGRVGDDSLQLTSLAPDYNYNSMMY